MREGRPAVLVVDDDPHLAEQVRWALKDSCAVSIAGGREAALRSLKRVRPDLVLADLCLPPSGTPEEGFRILRAALDQGRDAMVVIMSALEDREAALRAVAEGAYDYFHKPVDLGTLQV